MWVGCEFIANFIMEAVLKKIGADFLYEAKQRGASRATIHPEGDGIGIIDKINRLYKDIMHSSQRGGSVQIACIDLSLEFVSITL